MQHTLKHMTTPWTMEPNYLSLERNATTGRYLIRNANGEFLMMAPDGDIAGFICDAVNNHVQLTLTLQRAKNTLAHLWATRIVTDAVEREFLDMITASIATVKGGEA